MKTFSTRITNTPQPTPNSRIWNTVANVRSSNFQGGVAVPEQMLISAGMPIGLLLALTYAAAITTPAMYFGPRPNARIFNP